MVHGSALVVLPLTGLPVPVILAVALAVALSLRLAWRMHVSLRHPEAIRYLCWGEDNNWRLTRKDGTTLSTSLKPRVFIHPRLVVLRFRRSSWRAVSVLLTADRLAPESFRRLRVRLLIDLHRLAGSASP
jgi:hypothetical protein